MSALPQPQPGVSDAATTTYFTHVASPQEMAAQHHAVTTWQAWQELSQALEPVLMRPTACPQFVGTLDVLARRLHQLTQQDQDLAILHLVCPSDDKISRYSTLHAIHTAMLISLIAQRKEWGEPRALLGIQAALTMNLSLMQLQLELAAQQAPLSEAQRNEVHDHPLKSRRMLVELGVDHPDWLQAVAEHHEQSDGKGYPLGIDTPHPLADAIHTCDLFGAKLSPRVGRASLLSPRAAAEIFRQRSVGYFGATIIRELGLYPPGCLVELASGEQAVVVRRMPDQNAPDVVVLRDQFGSPLDTLVRSHTRRDSGRHIVSASLDQSWSPGALLPGILALA